MEANIQILLAADHAGFSLKNELMDYLKPRFCDIQDLGTYNDTPVDYPLYAKKLVQKMAPNSKGILICGSGIGMSIVANRFKGIRAALCINNGMAKLAREHNDANVIVFGSRLTSTDEAKLCIDAFLSTTFLGGRHAKRISLIDL